MLLSGVRVLDLSRLLPGAYCTQLLQAQGAAITKIEPPTGDPIRGLPGGDAYFEALHRGQQILTLDLRTETGRQALRRRVVDTEVLVEGFRPGVLDRMELGYAALSALNPALVYCAITGYGSSGAMAGRAGHDLNYLARSGALSLMPQRDGVPTVPGLQVADLAGGPLTGELPCYHVYPVRDGHLTVAALEPDFWQAFCRAIGRDDLASRQFDSSAVDEVQSVLAPARLDEWMARFGDGDVCVEPVVGLADASED